MEETKSVTDTQDFERRGRKAFLVSRSSSVRKSGSPGIEDPDMSSSVAG
jgi:hypothetical protein